MDDCSCLTFSRDASKDGTEVCVVGFFGEDEQPSVKNASATKITVSTMIATPVPSRSVNGLLTQYLRHKMSCTGKDYACADKLHVRPNKTY